MSNDWIGIPSGFVRERATADMRAALERLAEEHPDADEGRVTAVARALVDAYYAGAQAVAGELFAQLTLASHEGRLLYRGDDGELVPLHGHLHDSTDGGDSDDG